jgi:hypothetical protein
MMDFLDKYGFILNFIVLSIAFILLLLKNEIGLKKIVNKELKKAINYQNQKEKMCIMVQNHLQNNEKLSAAESIHLHNCKYCQFAKKWVAG